MSPERSFQGLILTLQRFWADYGCAVLQPYDMEVGAGTFHPATTLRALGHRTVRVIIPVGDDKLYRFEQLMGFKELKRDDNHIVMGQEC